MIVIPMAGLSSRFFKAGFKEPKYMLKAKGKYLFDHSVESFKSYFDTEKFVFIIRDIYETYDFVLDRIKELKIKEFDVVVLNGETRGQAETIALGLAKYRDGQEAITIFNIDTFRPCFEYPDLTQLGDGYLEVFQGSGDNWSFVKPIASDTTLINLTTEKKPISDLCCTGLYHFSSIYDFYNAYDNYLSLPKEQWEKGELYVAPLYNFLIQSDKKIHYHLIDRYDVIFCGTPDEYSRFIKN